ncbi:MAG TPA: peptidyl-prolyl cis-trans isomerase [Candidatus Deferrimicrobiaceae bacterium]|jgi:peptidyl-prolyl cis-trans isomerase C
MRKLMVVVLVAVPFLWSCSPAPKGKGEGKTLAVVNGAKITEASLEKEAQNLPPYLRPILDTPGGKIQLLDGMITRDLLMREAVRRGIDRRPDVQEKLAQARRSIVLESLLREVTEKAAVNDEVLRKFYNDNVAAFQVGERVRVKHILFKDKGKADAVAAKAKAGEPFDALMKAATAEGGTSADLGFIEKGSFVKEFEAAAFAAAPGTVVGPVKTTYGFHIIRVEDKRPAGTRSFDEVKGQLAGEMRERVQREAFDQLVQRLKKEGNVRLMIKESDIAPLPGMGSEAPAGMKQGAGPSQGAMPPAHGTPGR